MEKVKVTAKQAAEIEHHKQKGEEQIDYLIDIHSLNKRPDLAIAKMKPSQLIRALYFGYEVEPEFKLNDYVWHTENDTILKLDDEDRVEFANKYYTGKDKLRHATPSEIAEEKERRFFARYGREPWELKVGDLLKTKHTDEVVMVRKVKDGRAVIGDYTAYNNVDLIKKHYKVACFAENRLDREGDE